MSQAAVLIQNQFRTYYARRKKRGDLGVVSRRESERLKKGRNQSVVIQQRF
ncbi:calmodulin-binding transcription activator 1-like, partial [Elysia marginata]